MKTSLITIEVVLCSTEAAAREMLARVAFWRRVAIASVISLAPAFVSPAQVKASSGGAAIHAPKPEYPREALEKRLAGNGAVLMSVDRGSGRVTAVQVLQTTGHKILDEAAVRSFRQWRFKPGEAARVKMPISFTLPPSGPLPHIRGGGFAGVPDHVIQSLLAGTTPQGKTLSADQVKPLMLHAPSPPASLGVVGYTNLRIGVFLLKVRTDGTVSQIEVLQSTGAAIADSEVKNTFRKWRFRPGSLSEVRVPAYYHRTR
jgi:TonB family protein